MKHGVTEPLADSPVGTLFPVASASLPAPSTTSARSDTGGRPMPLVAMLGAGSCTPAFPQLVATASVRLAVSPFVASGVIDRCG